MTDAMAVVIPVHDAAATIGQQVRAVLAQLRPTDELVVVDDRSTDGSAEAVRSAGTGDERLRLVATRGGTGPAHARNVGAAASESPLLAFCDADDVVGEHWVASLRRSLAEHQLVSGWLEVESLNDPVLVSIRGRPPRSVPRLFDRLFFVHGACFGITRTAWASVGGMDEDPRLTVGEDIDLALRLLEVGVVPHFAPDAVVHYRYRSGPRSLFRQARAHNRVVPLLVRRMQQAGLGRPPVFLAPKKWLWLLVRLPLVRTEDGRARWAYQAGVRLGLLEGSIRHRTLVL